MIEPEEDMQYCLEAAERMWREVWLGCVKSDRKYRLSADFAMPAAMIAVKLFEYTNTGHGRSN